MSASLDDLLTAAAADLMAATADNSAEVSQRVLANLVRHFGVDCAFLRHNDHTIHATVLVAQWPPRQAVPDPDPIGVVYFADADPRFAGVENLKTPDVSRHEPVNAAQQRRIEELTGGSAVSFARVPLISGDVTTGTLSFVTFGDREWLPEEFDALQAVATLFAQLQARILAEAQICYLAQHDDLTNLHNRRALIAHLDERLAEGQPGPVAVLFVDLDRFKVVNDQLGQNAGDVFIEAFAALLVEAVDLPALIARFGGDEFVVVPLAPMSIETAEAFAQSVHARVHQQVVVEGETVSRTVSIGVATGTPGRDSTSDLLRHVDQATRSAKSSGGNGVATFSPEMSRANKIRNDIELYLEGIVESGDSDFLLHYLPEFDMRTGEILGTEALVRWQHPTLGLLMPDSFIGVVEAINLAAKLGRVVMRSACSQFGQWQSRGVGRGAVLRINVSPVQLVAGGIVETVAATLDEFHLDASSVCLEITENVVVADIDTTRETLVALKDLGVQIAIDDFGTGYSALTYLKSLPVDSLKIDRCFVRALDTDPGDQAIVRSTMALADAFGLDVIAEGVETVSAARVLLDLGCRRAQGFLLSRPVDSAAMEALFVRRFLPMDFATVEDSEPEGGPLPAITGPGRFHRGQ